MKARPYIAEEHVRRLLGAVIAQGKELTETAHVPRPGSPTPHTRARREPDGSPSPRCHMRQTRGCGCNAGRALPRTGREHSAPVAHSRAFRRRGGDEEIVPSPSGAQLPRPPPFSFSGIFRMPKRAAGWEERRGRGRGVAATRSAPAAPRGRRAAAALPTARPARATSVGTAAGGSRPALPTPRPSLRSRARHLTWVAFPHRLRGEEERALLDECLVKAVELPVHVGLRSGKCKWR